MEGSVRKTAEFAKNSTNNMPNINHPTILQPPPLPKMSQVHASTPAINSPRLGAHTLNQVPASPGHSFPPSSQNNGSMQSRYSREHDPNANMTLEDRLYLAIADDEPAIVASVNPRPRPAPVVEPVFVFREMVRTFIRDLPVGFPSWPFKADLFPEAVGPRETYWTEVLLDGFDAEGKRMKETVRKYRPDKKYQFETIYNAPHVVLLAGQVIAKGMGQVKSRKIPLDFIEGQEYYGTPVEWRYQVMFLLTVYAETKEDEDMEHQFPPVNIPGSAGQRGGIMVEDVEPSWDLIASFIRNDTYTRVFGPAPRVQQQSQMPTLQPMARPMDDHQREAQQNEAEQRETMRKQAFQIEAQKKARERQARQTINPSPQPPSFAAYLAGRRVSSVTNSPTQMFVGFGSETVKREAKPQFERYPVENLPIQTLYQQNATFERIPKMTTAAVNLAASQSPTASGTHCSGSSKRKASELGDDVSEGAQSPVKQVAASKSPNESKSHPPQTPGSSYRSPYPPSPTKVSPAKSSLQPQDSEDSIPDQSVKPKHSPTNEGGQGAECILVPSPAKQQPVNFNNALEFTTSSQKHRQTTRPVRDSSCSPGFGPPQKRDFPPRDGNGQQTQFENGPLMPPRDGREIEGSSSPGRNGRQQRVHSGTMQSSSQVPLSMSCPEWNGQTQRFIPSAMHSRSQNRSNSSRHGKAHLQQVRDYQAGSGRFPPYSPVQNHNVNLRNMQAQCNQSNSHQAGTRSVPPTYRERDDSPRYQITGYPIGVLGNQPQYRRFDNSGMPREVYSMHPRQNGIGGYQEMIQTPPRMNFGQNYMGGHQATPTPPSHRRMNAQQGYGLNVPPSPHPTSNPWPEAPQNMNRFHYQQQQDSMGPRCGAPDPPNYQHNQITTMMTKRQPFYPMINDTNMKLRYLNSMNVVDMQMSMAQPPSPRSAEAAKQMLAFGFPQPALGGLGARY